MTNEAWVLRMPRFRHIFRWIAKPANVLLIILFGLAGCGIAGYLWWKQQTAVILTTSLLSSFKSPDGQWEVRVTETIYEGTLVTVIASDVRLSATQERSKATDIVSVDTGGHDEDRPRVAWMGNHTLLVMVLDLAKTTVLARDVGGVRIDVREDRAGLAAREAAQEEVDEFDRKITQRRKVP